MTTAIIAAVALTAAATARAAFDRLARRTHWRIGRLGWLISFRRERSRCLRCRTDWRWALPHDIPIALEHGLCIFPLCQKCWLETDKDERLIYAEELMREWRRQGRYGPLSSEGFNRDRWDDERVAIYAAIKAGL